MSTLERRLDLRVAEDRRHLLTLASINPRHNADQVEQGLQIIASQLTEDWRLVTPWQNVGHVSLKTSQNGLVAAGVNSVIIPLASALNCLSDLHNFGSVIRKLNILGHEKESAVLEAVAAANYRLAGFEIELEPRATNGKRCDFRVRWDNRWIYFECKKENFSGSIHRKKLAEYAGELAQQIQESVTIPDDVCLHISLPKARIRKIGRKIIAKVGSRLNLGAGMNAKIDGAGLALVRRGTDLPLSPGYSRFSLAKVGKTSTPLLQATYIQVAYPSLGTRDIDRLRHSLQEARNQLPKDSLGMILYDAFQTEAVKPTVERMISNPSFSHVMGVVLMGNGAWLLRNPLYSSLPLEFAKHGIVPPV
jgi:hypothetical protein